MLPMCVRVCVSNKMFVPMYLTHLTVQDKVTVIMTVKKLAAILPATVIVSCDYLPSALSRHILHSSPQTQADRHLISLSIILQCWEEEAALL